MLHRPTLTADPSLGRYVLSRAWSAACCGHSVEIPAGFAFDGASIPWIAEPLTYSPFHPKVMAAALVHDFAYQTGALPRREADRIFHAILRADGVAPWRAWIMWAAVRLFAAGHYHGEATPREIGPDDTTAPIDIDRP